MFSVKAEASLQLAENAQKLKKKDKEIATLARQAAQFAEDAREIAIQNQIRAVEERRRKETEAAKQRAA